MKILWLDTETTGLDTVKHDVIEIACLIDIDGAEKERFHSLVRPFNPENASLDALAIHGHGMEEIKAFPEHGLVHKKLTDWMGRWVDKYDKEDKFFPAGQNVRFDVDMLKSFFWKSGDKYFGSWFGYHGIDLASVAAFFHLAGRIDLKDKDGKVSAKLESIARAVGLKQKEPHNAMDDVLLTRRIFYKLVEMSKVKVQTSLNLGGGEE